MDGPLLCVPHFAVGGKSEDKAIAICLAVLFSNAYDSRRTQRLMLNWVHQNRKLMNQGRLKEEKVEAFRSLLEVGEKLRRVNQWG